MLDFTEAADRRTFALELQAHVVHIARLTTALQNDLPSQVAGSNLISTSVQASQHGRRFVTEPSDERLAMIGEILDAQYSWLELLATADLMQPALIQSHFDRLTDLLAYTLHRND